MPNRTTLPFILVLFSALYFNQSCFAEELLLEDYEGGGLFAPADWANSFADSEGNSNSAQDAGKFAVVQWATQWSGIPSNGSARDVSRFNTFQVDVMVEKGQPVEEGSNFYFQLLNETSQGYSYWEIYVPQSKVPADGKWHRVKFQLSRMDKGHGDGGDAPTDFKTTNGTVCGMTFDEQDDKFKMKRASFDSVTLTDEEITETTVAASPKTVNPK
jgi:hypothetical protein